MEVTKHGQDTGKGYDQGKVKKLGSVGGRGRGGNNIPKDSDAILYQVCLKGVMDYYTSKDDLNYPEHLGFTPQRLNDMAFDIAKQAKANIQKLKG